MMIGLSCVSELCWGCRKCAACNIYSKFRCHGCLISIEKSCWVENVYSRIWYIGMGAGHPSRPGQPARPAEPSRGGLGWSISPPAILDTQYTTQIGKCASSEKPSSPVTRRKALPYTIILILECTWAVMLLIRGWSFKTWCVDSTRNVLLVATVSGLHPKPCKKPQSINVD